MDKCHIVPELVEGSAGVFEVRFYEPIHIIKELSKEARLPYSKNRLSDANDTELDDLLRKLDVCKPYLNRGGLIVLLYHKMVYSIESGAFPRPNELMADEICELSKRFKTDGT